MYIPRLEVPVTGASIIDTIPHLVDNFAGNILSYALVLAAVATITMAFLEFIKALFMLRLFYHKNKVKKWLKSDARLEELLILSVAEISSANALFDQPTDKMMGQIQAASNVTIDFPDTYPALYDFLTSVPRSPAAAHETGGSGNSSNQYIPSDGEVWKTFIDRNRFNYQHTTEQIQAATQARARIDHFVARKLDAFQTATTYRWARLNQILAVSASIVFLFVLLSELKVAVLPAAVLSLFGGMMAPLSKDIVSALSGLRTK